MVVPLLLPANALQFCYNGFFSFGQLRPAAQETSFTVNRKLVCLTSALVPTYNVQVSRPRVTLMLQINNGVYKSGFSTSQEAYDRAQRELYTALAAVEQRLTQHRFLVGDK